MAAEANLRARVEVPQINATANGAVCATKFLRGSSTPDINDSMPEAAAARTAAGLGDADPRARQAAKDNAALPGRITPANTSGQRPGAPISPKSSRAWYQHLEKRKGRIQLAHAGAGASTQQLIKTVRLWKPFSPTCCRQRGE